jgi:hypothetical protein
LVSRNEENNKYCVIRILGFNLILVPFKGDFGYILGVENECFPVVQYIGRLGKALRFPGC